MKKARLIDQYRQPGFRPIRTLEDGILPDARIVILQRRQKKAFVLSADLIKPLSTTTRYVPYGICLAAKRSSASVFSTGVLHALNAAA